MLFNQQALMDVYCRTVKVKKKEELQCNMPLDLIATDDMFYASYLGLAFAILFFVIHVFLTVLYTNAKRDYVTCFISGCYMPITLSAVLKVSHILMMISYPDVHRIGIGFDIVSHSYALSLTAGVISIFLGGIVLLFMACFTACTATSYSMTESYSIFYSIQLFGWLLSAAMHFCYFEYRPLPLFTVCFVFVTAFTVLIVGLCCGFISLCTTKKKGLIIANDPVIDNATQRLLYIVVYLILVAVPAGVMTYYVQEEFALVSGFDYEDTLAVAHYFTFRIIEYFSGPYVTLCVCLLPPIHTGFATLKSKFSKAPKEAKVPLLAANQVHPVECLKQPFTSANNSTSDYPFKPPQSLPAISDSNGGAVVPYGGGFSGYPQILPGTVPSGDTPAYITIPPNCNATVVYNTPIPFNAA